MTQRSRRIYASIIWFGTATLCAAVLSLAGVFLYLDPQIPDANTYRQYQLETPLRVYSQDGALLAEFGDRRLIPIGIRDVPQTYKDAVIFTEDKRFYEHSGIDWISLANDFLKLIFNPETRTGASTITMQIPRNVADLSREQTFVRKFKEMLLAIKIERELTKDEILELYINVVPFGKHAYGLQAAAYTYYGKPVDELNLAQVAMLAGVPKRPEGGNPINGPEWALNRRNLVLRRMLENDVVTQRQYDIAVASPISARVYGRELDLRAPYPAEWVRREVVKRYGSDAYSGYVVHTTINADHQAAAQRALRSGLHDYDRRHGYRGPEQSIETEEDIDPAPAFAEALATLTPVGNLEPAIVTAVAEQSLDVLRSNGETVTIQWDGLKWARPHLTTDAMGRSPKTAADVAEIGDVIRLTRADDTWRLTQVPTIQGAIVALEPETGAVTAMVGGYDFYTNQYNHALQAARQPGSGFKPFVYSAALAHGVTPANIYLDAPLVFEDSNLEQTYRPRNDSGEFSGPKRLREALYRSINLISMRVLLDVGAGNVLDHVAQFGFNTTNFPRNTQLAIGGGTMAVTPIEMARGYAVLANGGFQVEPHIIDRIEALDGTVIFDPTYPIVCDPCETEPLYAEIDTGNANTTDSRLDRPLNPSADIDAPAFDEDDAPIAAQDLIIPAPRTVDERNIFIVSSMLRDVIRRGTGRKALALDRQDLSGKTGTTNDAADTWFNGFQQDIVATVWVGFGNHAPIGAREYGSTTPLPIWIEFMKDVLQGVDEHIPSQPEGVVSIKIDPESGQLARPDQSNAIFEYFLTEHPPKTRAGGSRSDVTREEIRPEEIF